MIKILRVCIAATFFVLMNFAWADARVFTLNNPDTQQVLSAVKNRYGDKLHAELVQEKLVVIGTKQQLDEVSSLLTKLDPMPLHLRLHLREQPPEDNQPNVITYSSSDAGGYTLDTIEGAFVALDYSEITQQIDGAGSDRNTKNNNGSWWVTLNNTPTAIRSLTLQIRVQDKRNAIVVVSYTTEENQQRRVYGNTVGGSLGTWIALLPQPEPDAVGTISSGAKPGNQLYLRIDKILAGTQNSAR
jgi:hypothetical protein